MQYKFMRPLIDLHNKICTEKYHLGGGGEGSMTFLMLQYKSTVASNTPKSLCQFGGGGQHGFSG
jgi:hypothetical protein